MTKVLRFAALVKTCGHPQTVTLWTKPENNPALMKAVRENRVLTVIQKSSSHRKDFGLIGFQPHQFALYLVFPKRLPKADDHATVVGIRYDLIEEPDAPNPPAKAVPPKEQRNGAHSARPLRTSKPSPAKTPVPKVQKPVEKRYAVTLLRTASAEVTIKVAATDVIHAQARALEQVKRAKFKPVEIQDEVKSINEIGDSSS